uniref:Reverse transcriptase domain-containing protein n=1 Tax=Parascaris equorum TaxID=6256 RepID=A0A914R0Q6_PAREQ
CEVLLRVRLAPILITADVEKALLQIGLHDDQRGAVRFIWVKDVISSTNLRAFSFTRVPFGVISSPFLLNAILLDSESMQQSATLLGIVWELQEDTMVFNTKKCDNYPATKRQFLAYTAEAVQHATPSLKLFLQHLWKKKYDWD